MTATRTRGHTGRGGFTLIEVALTVFMLTIAMTLTVRLLGAVAAERRASERRQCAAEEVANLMEHLAARPWDRLSAEAVRDVRPSEATRGRLPDADLSVAVDEQDKGAAKRLSIRLRWRGRSGGWEAPVRLTAWLHRRNTP